MTESWQTDDPKLAEEVASRVTAGVLKIAKMVVPSYEDLDTGKRLNWHAPVLDGCMYVGSDRAPYAAKVQLRLDGMCKKKSAVRSAMELVQHGFCADLVYSRANQWLKLHRKSVRAASVGPDGLRLTVAEGIVELSLSLQGKERAYAEQVRGVIEERASSSRLLSGPFPMPELPEADAIVLSVGELGATASRQFEVGCKAAQLRVKPKSLAAGEERTCWSYSHPLGGRTVRIRCAAANYVADLYYRTLEI